MELMKHSGAKPVALIPLSQQIWEAKYRFRNGEAGDRNVEETWSRVAKAAAQAELPANRKVWERRFRQALTDFAFIPAGRVLAGAGTGREVTLFNCFVMGEIGDDMGSIFANVREAALTLQQGGGIGHDFSTLRPKGAPVRGVGADASGPVSFMDVWDSMCRTIMSAGARRGAMMGTLRCDHPDIEAFIEAKADPARLRNFNVSVLVTGAFLDAVQKDELWPLTFGGKIFRTVNARALWHKIMRSAYDYAEPGIIFIDRVNALNNLNYCETISSTNPCGEQPLPPYGACLLGSINLAALVEAPFTDKARLDDNRLDELVPVAVRLLDNVIDISRYPLPAQEKEAKAKRRIGLGITGLADALIFCGKHYGSKDGRDLAEHWMARISYAAYAASAELAAEKGAFPLFDAKAYLERPFPSSLPPEIKASIRAGIRNGVLTSIAPTGTISLLAGNVSSGIEPVFDFEYNRRILEPDGSARIEVVEDYAVRLFRKLNGAAELPSAFVTAHQLSPHQHLLMQAALQRHVDASISKTVNCPADIAFEDFETLYLEGYRLGLKGCTAYRPNVITGAVLSSPNESAAPPPALQPALPLAAPAAPEARPSVAPLPRERVLSGFTYKLAWPQSEHAMYITINDTIEGGQRRPFEIFINSKNLENYAWTVALTLMISAIFRRGGDVSFVVEELKGVFDPRGGAWMNGKYVPSLLAAIGGVIEQHFRHIGFGERSATASAAVSMPGPQLQGEAQGRPISYAGSRFGGTWAAAFCVRCGSPSVVLQEGCLTCRNCGYSTCS
jgi:ribonucleoside-diphosphate reductase alpha chain